MLISQTYDLNLTPGSVPLVINAHQSESYARAYTLRLVDDQETIDIHPEYDQYEAYIEGVKPDGNAFSYEATIDGNKFIFELRAQMVAVAGDVKCQCKVMAHGNVLISANFILRVQKDHMVDAPVSDTVIPGLVQQAQAASSDILIKMEALSSRMDTFSSLPPGSTSGNAELMDIRVGYDGTTYQNAGTAVREQVRQSVSDKLNLFKKEFTYDVQANGQPSTSKRALSAPMLVDGSATICVDYINSDLQLSIALYTGESASTFTDYTDGDWHYAGNYVYGGTAKYIRLYFGKKDGSALSDGDFVNSKITVIKGYDAPVYYEKNTAMDKVARAKIDSVIENRYLRVCSWNVGLWNNGIDQGTTLEKLYKWYRTIGDVDADIIATQESPHVVLSPNLDYATFLGNKYDHIYPPLSSDDKYAAKGIGSKYELLNSSRTNFPGSARTYIKTYVIFNKKRICLINVHIDYRSDQRNTQLNQLLGMMNDEEYVVCTGDLNIESLSELNRFTNAGYKLSNGGDFGSFNTWPHGTSEWPNEKVDHIIVSGNIRIQNVQELEGTGDYIVSDHKPLIASLLIK